MEMEGEGEGEGEGLLHGGVYLLVSGFGYGCGSRRDTDCMHTSATDLRVWESRNGGGEGGKGGFFEISRGL
jgi:hypothetical protein